MGTETLSSVLLSMEHWMLRVKLNNPLMGTETQSPQCIPLGFQHGNQVKLNNPH